MCRSQCSSVQFGSCAGSFLQVSNNNNKKISSSTLVQLHPPTSETCHFKGRLVLWIVILHKNHSCCLKYFISDSLRPKKFNKYQFTNTLYSAVKSEPFSWFTSLSHTTIMFHLSSFWNHLKIRQFSRSWCLSVHACLEMCSYS